MEYYNKIIKNKCSLTRQNCILFTRYHIVSAAFSETVISAHYIMVCFAFAPRTKAADANLLLKELRGFLVAGDGNLARQFVEY